MRIEDAKIKIPPKVKETDATHNQRVSSYTESYKGEYYNIELTKLIPFKNQTRKHFDLQSLEELANSIKAHGIRQPLTIIPSSIEEGKYEIISGERRWRAAKIAGLSRAPCIIIHDTEAAEEIALIENIQRKDLHPLELMNGFQSLLDRKICSSTQEIAQKLGINKSVVVETLSLSNLPYGTKQVLLEEGIKTRRVLRELVKTKQDDHLKVINAYKTSIIKKTNEKKIYTPSKVLSIYIQNGIVSIQDNKIEYLAEDDKQMIKKSLEELLKEITIK